MSHLWGVMTANLCGLNRDKLRDKRKRAGYYHNWVAWVRVTINWLVGVTITQFLWDFEASSVDYGFGPWEERKILEISTFPILDELCPPWSFELICSFRFSLFSCVSCLCSVLFMSSHSGLWKQRACPGVVLKIAFKNSFENAQEYTGCPTREHAQRMNTNNYGVFGSMHNGLKYLRPQLWMGWG